MRVFYYEGLLLQEFITTRICDYEGLLLQRLVNTETCYYGARIEILYFYNYMAKPLIKVFFCFRFRYVPHLEKVIQSKLGRHSEALIAVLFPRYFLNINNADLTREKSGIR